MDNTCLDDVRHQTAGGDEVRNNLTVCRDCSFVGAVIAVFGKSQSTHIPPPDIHCIGNGRSVQNEQLVWLSIFAVCVYNHIAAALSGDKSGCLGDSGLQQLRKPADTAFDLFNRGLHLGDSGNHAGLALTERNRCISFSESVVYGLNHHSGNTHTERRMPDGDGIAEVDPFQQSRILRLFPQRLKGNRDCGNGSAQRICADIRIRLSSKLVLGDFRTALKFTGEVHYERFVTDNLRCHNGKRYLSQGDHCFGIRTFRCVYGIRQQCGINPAVVLVLLQGSEVLAVFNDHTCFLPTMGMELHREVVPLKLTIPFREHGTVRTAKAGSDAFRLRDGKRLCIRIVRPACESCIFCKQLRENKLWRLAIRRERKHRHIGEVIRDVLTVDADDSV